MKEIWIQIGGCGYAVSSLGEIKNLATGRVLRGQPNHKGYLRVSLSIGRKTIHSLVAEHFISIRPIGAVINHKDGDKLNNHVSNLEYVSHAENCSHASDLGLIAKKTPLDKEIEISVLLLSGATKAAIARDMRVSPKVVARISRHCV